MAHVFTTVYLERLQTNLDGTVEAIDRCERALDNVASSYLLLDQNRTQLTPVDALLGTMIENNLAYTMEYNKATRELTQTIKAGWLTFDEIARLYQQNTCGVADNTLLDGTEIGLAWMDLTPEIKELCCGGGSSAAMLETVQLLGVCKAEAVRLRQSMLESVAKTATLGST